MFLLVRKADFVQESNLKQSKLLYTIPVKARQELTGSYRLSMYLEGEKLPIGKTGYLITLGTRQKTIGETFSAAKRLFWRQFSFAQDVPVDGPVEV